MSLPHFYLEQQILADETAQQIPLRLSAEDLKHFKVLRLRRGEHIAVIDAARDYFECEITDEDWNAPKVRICLREIDPVTGPEVVLIQGIAKGDKLDTIARQATEVGVSGMVFAPFKRCVVSFDERHGESRLSRWETIAKSAAMQSGRLTIPEVELAPDLSAIQRYITGANCVLVFWEEAPLDADFAEALEMELARQHCPAQDARVCIVIGPEGGLEPAEVEHLRSLSNHVHTVTLGPSILRTETAGVVAPALVLYALRRMSDEA